MKFFFVLLKFTPKKLGGGVVEPDGLQLYVVDQGRLYCVYSIPNHIWNKLLVLEWPTFIDVI